ncbi:MAG TPA: hypothetical protein VGL21_10460 [Jatrophihabitantaceae bacterium]
MLFRRLPALIAAVGAALIVAASIVGGLGIGASHSTAAGAAVPVPTGNDAVITVRTVGDRTAAGDPTPLAGVVLGLAPDNNTGQGFHTTCTSDADGDCSFVVPDTEIGGANRDVRFVVGQNAAPAGWDPISSVALPNGAGRISAAGYAFETGPQLRAGQTYRSGQDFMVDTGVNDPRDASGVWVTPRADDPLTRQCGLQIALAIDMTDANPPTAAVEVVDAIGALNQPSVVSLFPFAPGTVTTPPPAPRLLLPVNNPAQARQVDTIIDSFRHVGSDVVDWDSVLRRIAEQPEHYDAAMLISDRYPTTSHDAPPGIVRVRPLEDAVLSANELKAGGTWIAGLAPDNALAAGDLHDIAGPDANDVHTGDPTPWLNGHVLPIVDNDCQKPLTIVKRLVPFGGTTADATPGAGFAWDATVAGGAQVRPFLPTNAAGQTQATVQVPSAASRASVTLTERAHAGYAPFRVGGATATCTRTDTGAAVPTTNSGQSGFTVPIAGKFPVRCVVYDRATAASHLTLHNTWVVNGTSYPEGSQPAGLVATPALDGVAVPWGQVGTTGTDQPVISETTDLSARPLCTLVGARLISLDGFAFPGGDALPFRVSALPQAQNTGEITTTVTCTASLTLVATGGAAPWTLRATGPAGAQPGPSGASGAHAAVTPDVRYTLAEFGGDPLYVQSGAWACVALAADGTTLPGYTDGADGGVTVPAGYSVRCTVTNKTSSVVLRAAVVNSAGGSATAADWTLSATPTGSFPGGVGPVSEPGNAGTRLNIRPGTTYLLGADGPAGYTASDWQCATAGSPPTAGATLVTQPGDAVTCTITETQQQAPPPAPRLTLVLSVDNGATGGTAVPSGWTLHASGPVTLDGTSGSAAVTDVSVPAGTYALSADGGPNGYQLSDWTCTGGTGAVTLAAGDVATCTVTATAQPSHLTLGLTIVPPDGGSPADWTLTATGPVTVSGHPGDGAITDATVPIGSYTLNASGPDGATASNWDCNGVASGPSVTLALGDTATCVVTFTAPTKPPTSPTTPTPPTTPTTPTTPSTPTSPTSPTSGGSTHPSTHRSSSTGPGGGSSTGPSAGSSGDHSGSGLADTGVRVAMLLGAGLLLVGLGLVALRVGRTRTARH